MLTPTERRLTTLARQARQSIPAAERAALQALSNARRQRATALQTDAMIHTAVATMTDYHVRESLRLASEARRSLPRVNGPFSAETTADTMPSVAELIATMPSVGVIAAPVGRVLSPAYSPRLDAVRAAYHNVCRRK